MKITPDIIRSEFIGTRAKVNNNNYAREVCARGRIIDETRNTFTVLNEGGKRIVIKSSSIFGFESCDHSMLEIDGKLLVGRPEDRLKRCIRRLW